MSGELHLDLILILDHLSGNPTFASPVFFANLDLVHKHFSQTKKMYIQAKGHFYLFIIFFLYFLDRISIEGIFWLYGSISFVGLIFITIFVPETKGKNEAQLSEYFAKSKLETTIIKSSASKHHHPSNNPTTKDLLSNPMHTT